jgi:polyhydroxybutyrate depolymerase
LLREYLDPQTYLEHIEIGGQERLFMVHIPTGYDADRAVPLVFSLHGAGSNAFAQESASQWIRKADEEGFVVVTPQAIEPSRVWLGVYLDELGDPDMEFFAGMLATLQGQLSIDPARIFATGLSNGGTMANRLGCDLSQSFAAIAPVAGAHSGFFLCEVSEPVSVLAVHGTDDTVIPYEGNGSDVPPVRTWVEAWAERDGCVPESAVSEPYPEVFLEAWSQCNESAEVSMLTVQGGGHTWLGLEFSWEEGRYVTTTSATDAIWDFFVAHPKLSDS